MNIDRKKVRDDLAARVLFIRELKRAKRESGQPNWSGEKARLLLGWQVQITLLCMLLAHSRGRLHCRRWDQEKFNDPADQARFVGALGDKYGFQIAA